jgi:hypothetical protein
MANKKNKTKKESDWFDTHLQVIGLSNSKNKRIKDLIKEKLIKSLSKDY